MKKKMKSKLIAAVMSLAMVFTMVPIMGAPVYADDTASDPLYAVFDSTDGSLTFKREAGTYTNGEEVGTKTYYTGFENTKYSSENQVPWFGKRFGIKKVDFQATVAPVSCGYWFYECENLKEVLNADKLDTSGVTNMNCMFMACDKLASIDVSKWNTSEVEDMSAMFHGCSSLDFLDLYSWVTSEAIVLKDMFKDCTSLSSVRLGERFSFKGYATDSSNYAVLPDAPASLEREGKWICESSTKPEGVTAVALRDNYPNATTPDYAIGTYVWAGSTKVAVFDSTDDSLTFKLEMKAYYDGQTDGTKTYYTGFENKGYSVSEKPSWIAHASDIKKVVFRVPVFPENCAYWFYKCRNLEEVQGADRLDTSQVTSMERMFNDCLSLTSLDVSGWNTSKVKDMSYMFADCSSLSSVTLGEEFSFKGAVSNSAWYAVLDDAPDDAVHTGKWVNSSDPAARGVTAADLRDNYPSKTDTSYAPGTYVWEVCSHKLSGTLAKEETCTEAGNNAYWTCSECGKYFSDAQGTNRIDENSWIIPAKGHRMTHHDAVAPTCTKDGTVEYYACGNCNKNFADNQGITEIDAVVDLKKGHNWNTEWSTDGDKHWHECSDCGEKNDEDTHDWKAATCTEAKTCEECGLKERNPLGHKWDVGKVSKAATEQTEGEKTYTCTVCKATKTETIPKLTPAPTPKPEPTNIKVSKQPSVKIKAGKKSLTIGWRKVKGAAGYDIFFAQCNHKHKKHTCKNVKRIKGNKTFTWKKSGLKKGTAYKSYVKAYIYKNGKKKYIYTSPVMYAYTGNGTKKYTNAKSVKLKNVKKGKLSLKKGKTFKIKAKVNKVNKKKKLMPKSHAPTLRYMTSNKKIATVSSKGKIKAVAKGKCYIYAYAHNGVCKKVRVTVK